MIHWIIGTVLVLVGGGITWAALRGVFGFSSGTRPRVDPSVFAVMDLHAQAYRPKIAPPTVLPKIRRDTLGLDPPLNEAEKTPPSGLFSHAGKGTEPPEPRPPSALRIRSRENDEEEDPKTLGL